MTDVVINCCYGGFELSDAAYQAIAQRKGWTVKYYHDGCKYPYWDTPDLGHMDYYTVARDDADLVAVVRELGSAADGACAQLKIVSIPDGVDYCIEEYDGMEWIAEAHRTWD